MADLGGDEKTGRLVRNKNSMKASQKTMMMNEDGKNEFDARDWGVMERRFVLSGKTPIPHFQDRSWVPKNLSANINEDMDCLGSLWLHRMAASTSRAGNQGFIFDSIGRFLFGLDDCQCVVMTWPADKTLLLGAQSWMLYEYLELIKSKDKLDEFLSEVKHFPLKENSAVWIPYGWSCCVAAMPTEDPGNANHNGVSFYLTATYMNKDLWNKVPESTRRLIISYPLVIIMEACMNAPTFVSLHDSNFVPAFLIGIIS